MSNREPITPDEVRRRAAVAGVTIDEDAVAEVARVMEISLAPLRALDLRAIRLVEPAVTFDARTDVGSTR
jgi:hypothetical protein